MSLFKKNNPSVIENDEILDEQSVEEMRKWSRADFENPNKIKQHLNKKKSKSKKQKEPIVRVEDLEKVMAEHGESIDPETVVSMYMPRRRAKRLGAALLRLDKAKLALLALAALILVLFILAFSQEKMGNFTINLNRLEMYRRGVSISADGDFTDPTARLEAGVLQDATNMTIDDLPEDIDEIEGNHNGRNYVAYTYYVRNAGKEKLVYQATVNLENASKGAEDAIRVAVWRNGDRVVYAEPSADGKAESGCVNFINHDLACSYIVEDFEVGYVDRYTVAIWLEGNDPECVDDIVGGSLQFSMNIDAVEDSNTTLITKLVEDIKETISGQKSIGAAGTDSPSYYDAGNVTWETRRNK